MADTLIERLTGRTTADPANIEINLLITPDALFNDTTDPLTPDTGTAPSPTGGQPATDPAPAQTAPASAHQTNMHQTLAERVAAATATLITEGLDPMVIPAGTAKDLLLNRAATVFLRRIFGTPGHLITMETKSRAFTGNLRKLIILRDQYCQHPWCAAPIRHIDHRIPHSRGGPTSAHNAQGLCAHHNLTKAEHEQRDTHVPAA